MKLSNPISICCCIDAACADESCPGRAIALALQQQKGCSACSGGPCPTPDACLRPIAEVRPISRRLFSRRPFLPETREGWGRAIGAALGIAGFLFFAGAIGRHLGFF